MQGIKDEISSTKLKNGEMTIEQIRGEESIMGIVVVTVVGNLVKNDTVKKINQIFILAPDDNRGGGFYVHNDIMLVMEIINKPVTTPLSVVMEPQEPSGK